MKFLGEDVVRHLGRVLQFAPVAIAFFFALSFWRKGFTEGAIITGLMGIGLLLLIVLLHVIEKITGNTRRFVLVCSTLVIAIGVYSLIDGDIYMGISQMAIGMSLIFGQLLKGKWQHICCAAALGIAVGAIILEEINDNKPHATEREVGVQQEVTGRRYFHA
jgi:hypothetical protein